MKWTITQTRALIQWSMDAFTLSLNEQKIPRRLTDYLNSNIGKNLRLRMFLTADAPTWKEP
jgi:hypothetical protein